MKNASFLELLETLEGALEAFLVPYPRASYDFMMVDQNYGNGLVSVMFRFSSFTGRSFAEIVSTLQEPRFHAWGVHVLFFSTNPERVPAVVIRRHTRWSDLRLDAIHAQFGDCLE
jgi:hypothetical protein